MAEIRGTYDSRFSVMADLLSANIDSGADVGASVAVTLDGAVVVDIWAGWTDETRTAPWHSDTITNVWSCTKTVTSLAALVLVERGELDVFKPVAYYWPEFAANGKGAIEVRHLLSHTSGVSGWEQPVELADLYDWEKSTAMLAAQAPWWEPGSASGYHDRNFGHLVGEVTRRITGQKLGEFVAQEIAGPLRADFHIGLDPSQFHRVSNVIPFPLPGPPPADAPAPDPNSVSYKTTRTCDLIFREQSNGVDLVLGGPVRFGIGYALKNESLPYLPAGRACGWGGWGGSIITVDLDRRMTISYVMNRMESGMGGERGPNFVRVAYAALNA